MKKKFLIFTALLLIFIVGFSACKEEPKEEEIFDTIIRNFYVFDFDFEGSKQCGYLLFEDTGTPGDYHGSFVWAENLPEQYLEHLLPVTVTFHYTGERCGNYPIINIIKIQKQ